MTNLPLSARTSLVIFDLFGTLVSYSIMRHPFLQLFKWARKNGRVPRSDDARRLMTINGDVQALAMALGLSAPAYLIDQAQKHIQEGLASLALYDDVKPTLAYLQDHDIAFAVCSNLAFPYGEAATRLLSDFQFTRCLSYEVGFIKPEENMYRYLINTANVHPAECLFVGDSLPLDYQGPIQAGMRALHLVRNQPIKNEHSINSLTEVLIHLGR